MDVFKQKFDQLSQSNPNLSSWVVFSRIVNQYNYSESFIREAFEKFVEKGDYLKSEFEALISGLVEKHPKK